MHYLLTKLAINKIMAIKIGLTWEICGQWFPITPVSHRFHRDNVQLLPNPQPRQHSIA